MEEIQHFVQKSDDPRVSLSLSGATFAWDKVGKWTLRLKKIVPRFVYSCVT